MSTSPPDSRLVLLVHPGAGAVDRVAAALTAANVATLIIAQGKGGDLLDAGEAKTLVDLAQAKNVAALISDDAQLARVLKADGVHLTWSEDVVARHAEVREFLGPRFITGADAGTSRHTAMELGEANADYVAFGIPSANSADAGFDRDGACEFRIGLVDWWAAIFQPPVVACDVETAEEAAELARAGADFIAVTLPAIAPANIADWLRPFLAALAQKNAPV